jgi:hypothetical protein
LFSRALLGDRLDEETGLAEIELIVEGESLRIVGEASARRSCPPSTPPFTRRRRTARRS